MTTSGGESAVVAEADDVVRVVAGPAEVESTTNTGADGGGIESVDDDGNAAHRRRFEGGNRRLVGARRGLATLINPRIVRRNTTAGATSGAIAIRISAWATNPVIRDEGANAS